jgi:hypothetical protein
MYLVVIFKKYILIWLKLFWDEFLYAKKKKKQVSRNENQVILNFIKLKFEMWFNIKNKNHLSNQTIFSFVVELLQYRVIS